MPACTPTYASSGAQLAADPDAPVWVFGYGSLIWRAGFPYLERCPASVQGFKRRFWQGSHDHRGTPDAPGRVVTLVPAPGAICHGMAYRIDHQVADQVFANLDHRERNGYSCEHLQLDLGDRSVAGRVYIGSQDNHAWMGPAPLADMARQIQSSQGDSGANRDYLVQLAEALAELNAADPHVTELLAAVQALDEAPPPGNNRPGASRLGCKP